MGKDDNFRGMTIYNDTLYVTKGSGSNGVNTVYQVGPAGALAHGASIRPDTAQITILGGGTTTTGWKHAVSDQALPVSHVPCPNYRDRSPVDLLGKKTFLHPMNARTSRITILQKVRRAPRWGLR
jgi:hypothetical protein